jgi:hypothetical protein
VAFGAQLRPVVIGPPERFHDGRALPFADMGSTPRIVLDFDVPPNGEILIRLRRDVIVLIKVGGLHPVIQRDVISHSGVSRLLPVGGCPRAAPRDSLSQCFTDFLCDAGHGPPGMTWLEPDLPGRTVSHGLGHPHSAPRPSAQSPRPHRASAELSCCRPQSPMPGSAPDGGLLPAAKAIHSTRCPGRLCAGDEDLHRILPAILEHSRTTRPPHTSIRPKPGYRSDRG